MRRPKPSTVGLRERLGMPSRFVNELGYWTMTEIAVAIGRTEQCVRKWALNGQIPPMEILSTGNHLSEVAVKLLEQYGVRDIGGYFPITTERAKQLKMLGYKVPKDATKRKKGGAE